MTSQLFENPQSIQHFQSICDACQQLTSRYHTPSELKLYADGYLDAIRKMNILSAKDQERLETLVTRWIMDPSSFVGPDGDINNLYFQKQH